MAKYNTGKGLPCGWALLPGKSEEVYQLMLDGIMTKINTDGEVHKPQRIIVDFEAAVIKTLRARLPGVKIAGCAFHFRKAIWHKLQEIGLTTFFYRDLEFQQWIHMIYALAYVPVERVVGYYKQVVLHKLAEKSEAAEDTDCYWDQ